MAQRLQANLLLQGRFFARLDAPPEFFSAPGVVITPAGRLYSQFPIGGPAAIALGVAIGAPWVINPLLTGLTALGVYRFAAAVYGEPIGRASGVLFGPSPLLAFVGGRGGRTPDRRAHSPTSRPPSTPHPPSSSI